ncbi:TetR family transcriptional regulator [Paraburkholderia sediminicola]|uniref:TetR family transcriptional regulator n=1 Tax=Paraburkholderia sediminicola TaxID=458836 RepID=UPI001582559F
MNERRSQNSSDTLNVRERVQAAILFLRENNGLKAVTVSAVCRAAGVSRASLYQHHRDIVDEISQSARTAPAESASETGGSRRVKGIDQHVSELQHRLRESEARYRAVLYVCLEQQAELVALRQELESQLASRMPGARTRTMKRK